MVLKPKDPLFISSPLFENDVKMYGTQTDTGQEGLWTQV